MGLGRQVDSAMATIRLIGVPLDLGQSRRGVDMGPSALRIANLAPRLADLGHTIEQRGNLEIKTLPEKQTGIAVAIVTD